MAGTWLTMMRGTVFCTSTGDRVRPFMVGATLSRSSAMLRTLAPNCFCSAARYLAPFSGSDGKVALVIWRSSKTTVRSDLLTRVRAVAKMVPKDSVAASVGLIASAVRKSILSSIH